MPQIGAAKTGDYPRIFITNRNTELLATLAVNEPITRGDLAKLLDISRRQAQEQLDSLMKAGIVMSMPAYTLVNTPTRMNALFAIDRGHAVYPETSALLRCLARKFHAPINTRPQPNRIIPYKANRTDPTMMLGWDNQAKPLILIALLGWVNGSALRSVLPKTGGTMFYLTQTLVNSGLVSRRKIGAYVVLRIDRRLPCRKAFVTLLKRLGKLSSTYVQLARNARRELPKLLTRRRKRKRTPLARR